MSGVLCLVAHPDDELFCAGGLSIVAERAVPVRLVCFTRGEGGRQMGDPPIATPETIGRVREQEMHHAARALKAASLDFLDHVDRPQGEQGHRSPDVNAPQLALQILALLKKYQPRAVLTHGSGGEYGHPAHRLLHEATQSAVEQSNPQPALYGFMACHPSLPRKSFQNTNDWAHMVIDVRTVEAQRFAILQSHKTQWVLFAGKQDSEAAYKAALLDRIRRYERESYHLFDPGDCGDPLRQWLGARDILQHLSPIAHYGARLQWWTEHRLPSWRTVARRALARLQLLEAARSLRTKIGDLRSARPSR